MRAKKSEGELLGLRAAGVAPDGQRSAATDGEVPSGAADGGTRLELDAVPHAFQALEETFEIAGEEALRATSQCIDTGLITTSMDEPSSLLDPHEMQGRNRFAPMPWSGILRHRRSISFSSGTDDPGKKPATLNSRLAFTLANLAWRVANDAIVRAHLSGQRVNGIAGPRKPVDLPLGSTRFDLADHALAITACTLVSDAIRDTRTWLQQDTKAKWYQSSNSRILWAIFTSEAGLGLNAGEWRYRVGPANAPAVPRRGSPGMSRVSKYEAAAVKALAGRVTQVVKRWCAPDAEAMHEGDLLRRAEHWSRCALVQVQVWLGQEERVHGENDTPW